MKRVDISIVGAGPAGLACAMQAKRQGLTLAVFERDRPGGQALAAHSIENFPGFPKGIAGRELMERFIEQVLGQGVEITCEEVMCASHTGETFEIETTGGTTSSRVLVVASGLRPKRLGVPGEDELAGSRVFYYAEADRVPHTGKEVLVVGSGDAAFDQALSFSRTAGQVAIAMKYDEPRCNPRLLAKVAENRIDILPSRRVTSIREDGGRLAVAFDEGEAACDLLVACIGKEQNLDFLDPTLRAGDRPGFYFAGDCWRGRDRHISIAIGDGIAAAMKAVEYIKTRDT
jgi:thioredoxin reductase (NADPH)